VDSLISSKRSNEFNPALLERLLFRVSKQWIAGYTAQEALFAAQDSNNSGMFPILNYLGEEVKDEARIDRTVSEYMIIIDLLNSSKVSGAISIKPTQIGLAIDNNLLLKNLRRISEYALRKCVFVWIDMEAYQYVENTLSTYLNVLKINKQVGIVIQAYLKRSFSDLMHLMEQTAHVRLVKGAYTDDETKAYRSDPEIDKNFSTLMEFIFSHRSVTGTIAIATHHSKLIEKAILLSQQSDSRQNLQFQMLRGIRNELKTRLIQRGYRVGEYIPYGETWLPYSIRRIRERKRNILLLARSLIQS
jgi:proline dehydrogenase